MENLENTSTETVESTGAEEKKTYTEEEVQTLLQKEGDRRITQYQKTLEKKNREADRLSKMTDTEKYEYTLQERERALEEKERALTLAENKATVSQILSDKGLSLSLVDFVVAEDADVMDANIKILEKAFKQSVKAEVEKRLGSESPRKNLPTDNVVTKDNISKMGYQDLMKFKNEQPELWAELMK